MGLWKGKRQCVNLPTGGVTSARLAMPGLTLKFDRVTRPFLKFDRLHFDLTPLNLAGKCSKM